jgi:hypothetical protein
MTKRYGFNGLAGCVTQRRTQQTGTTVGIYHAEQAELDVQAGPWAIVCEEHHQIVHVASLAMAKHHASDPLGWCEVCNGTETEA